MTIHATECLLRLHDEHHELEDYQSGVPRWCTGCGDNAILASICARNVSDATASDFGYRPAVAAILERMATALR